MLNQHQITGFKICFAFLSAILAFHAQVCQTVYEDIYDVKPKVKIQISVQDYNYGNFEDQEKEIVESDNKDEEQDFQSDEEINDENVTIAEKLSEERENRNLIEKIKRIVSDPKAMKKMIKDKIKEDRQNAEKLQSVSRFRLNKNNNKKSGEKENLNSTGNDGNLLEFAGLPNLFSENFAQLKGEIEKNQNCTEAFQFYYDKANERQDPKSPAMRLRMTLQGNESAEGKWKSFFHRGPDNSTGYDQCFKPDNNDPRILGKGPCSKAFLGTECPFFPDYPLITWLHPACCDKSGCFCECIYICSTKRFITALHDQTIKSFEFLDCTTKIKSIEEGIKWKEEKCEKTKETSQYTQIVKECSQNNTKAVCVRQGHCIKSICKFCFRWQCEDEELLKSTEEEEKERKRQKEKALEESKKNKGCSKKCQNKGSSKSKPKKGKGEKKKSSKTSDKQAKNRAKKTKKKTKGAKMLENEKSVKKGSKKTKKKTQKKTTQSDME